MKVQFSQNYKNVQIPSEMVFRESCYCYPRWGKIGKICQTGSEKLFFTANFVQSFAVKSVKLCNFTASEPPHFSAYYKLRFLHGCETITSCMSATSSTVPPLIKICCSFVMKLNQNRSAFCKTCALNFGKISGEIRWSLVSSLLRKMHDYSGELLSVLK